MRRMWRFFVFILFFAVLLGRATADEPIRVGMSGAFSGPISALGMEIYRGASAYFEHVNRTGGIKGRPIHFIAYDDAYDPAITLDNTVRLVEEDKVQLLFSFVGTPTVTRILPLLKTYKDRNILLFFPVTGAEPHRRPPYDQFVFNLRASYSQEAEALVRKFTDLGKTRFAILYQADAYGRSGWEGLRNALQRRGLDIVEEATYQRGFLYKQSMDDQVNILRGAAPDVVISIATYAAAAAFIRDARDIGWDVLVANVSFVNSERMLDLLVDQGRLTGRDYTHHLVNSQVVPSYEDYSQWGVMEYRWIMDQCSCVLPDQLTFESHEPKQYSFASFEGLLNAKVLVNMLRSMTFDDFLTVPGEGGDHGLFVIPLGIGPPIVLGPEKRQGLEIVYFSTVHDQRLVPLSDWDKWGRP